MAYRCSNCGHVMSDQKGKCPNCGVNLIDVGVSQPTTQGSGQVDARCKNCQAPVKIDDFVCHTCGSLLSSHIIFWITLISIFVIAWGALVALIIILSLNGNSTANAGTLLGFGLPWLGLIWWLRYNFVKLSKARSIHDNFFRKV